MRHIQFDPADLDGADRVAWGRWMSKCSAASVKMGIDFISGQSPDCDAAAPVWRAGKELLLRLVYLGKCGYCEFQVTGGAFGTADHHRPKGRVRVLNAARRRVVVRSNRPGMDHVGYWWLAVDWSNLVPACDRCNSYKSDLFPVHGNHCEQPRTSNQPRSLRASERPLLLHPLVDRPEAHLSFGQLGDIAEVRASVRGRATIDTLRLDRDDLVDARRKRLDEAREAFRVAALLREGADEECGRVFARYTEPSAPYSVAVRQELQRYVNSGEVLLLQER